MRGRPVCDWNYWFVEGDRRDRSELCYPLERPPDAAPRKPTIGIVRSLGAHRERPHNPGAPESAIKCTPSYLEERGALVFGSGTPAEATGLRADRQVFRAARIPPKAMYGSISLCDLRARTLRAGRTARIRGLEPLLRGFRMPSLPYHLLPIERECVRLT
jgi:hypothetical protein